MHGLYEIGVPERVLLSDCMANVSLQVTQIKQVQSLKQVLEGNEFARMTRKNIPERRLVVTGSVQPHRIVFHVQNAGKFEAVGV